MTPFDELRHLATERRDEKLRQARDEFKASCELIDDLERQFNKGVVRRTNTRTPVVAYILECVTPGKPFTLRTIMATLKEKYPTRKPLQASVRKTLFRLRLQGLIKRVGKDDRESPVLVLESAKASNDCADSSVKNG